MNSDDKAFTIIIVTMMIFALIIILGVGIQEVLFAHSGLEQKVVNVNGNSKIIWTKAKE